MNLRILALLLVGLMLSACGGGGSSHKVIDDDLPDDYANMDDKDRERYALERIGDVRVYVYLKPSRVVSARNSDDTRTSYTEQKEMLQILINTGHSAYKKVPDYQLAEEERFLKNADMYDLLRILRDQLHFFDKGMSINILGEDPVKRAKSEANTDRIIAVEQIRNGKVNTSYFARFANADMDDDFQRDRVKYFNQAQGIILEAYGNALPRGVAGQGEGDSSGLRNQSEHRD